MFSERVEGFWHVFHYQIEILFILWTLTCKIMKQLHNKWVVLSLELLHYLQFSIRESRILERFLDSNRFTFHHNSCKINCTKGAMSNLSLSLKSCSVRAKIPSSNNSFVNQWSRENIQISHLFRAELSRIIGPSIRRPPSPSRVKSVNTPLNPVYSEQCFNSTQHVKNLSEPCLDFAVQLHRIVSDCKWKWKYFRKSFSQTKLPGFRDCAVGSILLWHNFGRFDKSTIFPIFKVEMEALNECEQLEVNIWTHKNKLREA